MKQSMVVLAAVAVALLVALAPAALAGETSSWVGRDVDNSKIHWSCTNTSGDDWVLKRNGSDRWEYEVVARGRDYVELQLKGTKTFERIRLYSDKLVANENGSKFRWVTLARGKWQK